MLVRISGTETEIPEGLSLQELMDSRNLPDHLIVALNDNIIRAEQWGSTRLEPNDVVEMIRLVAGG